MRRAGVEQLYHGKANDWRNREHVCAFAVLRMSSDAISNKRGAREGFFFLLSLPPPPSSRRLFSLLFHLLSSLLLCLLSVSVSLSLCLSPCDVALVLCLVCVCVLGEERESVCTCKTPSVSRFKTSPCVLAPRTCVTICGRGASTHGDVLNRDTGVFSVPHHTTHTHHDHSHSHSHRHHRQRKREKRRRKKERQGKKTEKERREDERQEKREETR